jgi:hypothetical protein
MRIVIALLAAAALLGGTAVADAKTQGHAHKHAFHQHKDNPPRQTSLPSAQGQPDGKASQKMVQWVRRGKGVE